MNSKLILDAAGIQLAIEKVVLQIIQTHPQGEGIYLIGIQRGGVFLAQRIAAQLQTAWKKDIPLGELDINMHRDDLDSRSAPPIHPTRIPDDISGKSVILVDDVIYRGRTCRAALDALNDYGRPKRIQLAVLIDRGHLELPIRANFVGQTVETQVTDLVEVRLHEVDGEEGVILKTA